MPKFICEQCEKESPCIIRYSKNGEYDVPDTCPFDTIRRCRWERRPDLKNACDKCGDAMANLCLDCLKATEDLTEK